MGGMASESGGSATEVPQLRDFELEIDRAGPVNCAWRGNCYRSRRSTMLAWISPILAQAGQPDKDPFRRPEIIWGTLGLAGAAGGAFFVWAIDRWAEDRGSAASRASNSRTTAGCTSAARSPRTSTFACGTASPARQEQARDPRNSAATPTEGASDATAPQPPDWKDREEPEPPQGRGEPPHPPPPA